MFAVGKARVPNVLKKSFWENGLLKGGFLDQVSFLTLNNHCEPLKAQNQLLCHFEKTSLLYFFT